MKRVRLLIPLLFIS
jgi:hypothetical protein